MDLRGFLLKLHDGSIVTFHAKSTMLGSKDLQLITGCLSHLRHIDLSRCKELRDTALEPVVLGCSKTLLSINLSYCLQLTSDAIGWLAGTVGSSGRKCSQLQSCQFAGCSGMTDKALTYLGESCHKLKSLNAAECTKVWYCHRRQSFDLI